MILDLEVTDSYNIAFIRQLSNLNTANIKDLQSQDLT